MSSEKQIAANRANASRSKGPKTLDGKRRASRNALRHGLSSGITTPAFDASQLSEMLKLLCSEGAPPERRQAAVNFAIAQAELQQISVLRSSMSLQMDKLNDAELWRLAALDRYDRRALTRRRRALAVLEP